MSNTRRIDLDKLARVMAGQTGIARRPPPSAPVRAEPAFPRVTAERIDELLDDNLMARCESEFYASDHRRTGIPVHWVTDLGGYKRLRAASGDQADPDTWEPADGDRFFGVPVHVRVGGGPPHLEPVARPRYEGWYDPPRRAFPPVR